MVRWHYRLNEPEFELAPGVGGQGSLACCSPWGCKESDTTEQLLLTTLIGPHLEVKLLGHVRLSDCMDCNPPGSSVRGIFQARGLE